MQSHTVACTSTSVRGADDRGGRTWAHGPSVAIAVTLGCCLLLAGCGESSEEKATKQICSATTEINKQLQKLQTLPLSSSFVTEAKAAVEAIDTSIKKIDEAAPNVPSARKEELDAAKRAFQSEIAKITKDVATASQSTNVEAALKSAEPQVKAALSGLATDYKKAFEALKCS
jgi:hypothetical protein